MKPLALLAAILFFMPTGQAQTHDQLLGKPDLLIRDAEKELKNTTVAGTLLEKQEPGKSYLWCGTIQLAWNELRKVMGPPLIIDSPMASQLGTGPLEVPVDLDADSYVARAGFGKDNIVQQIQKELEQKFKGAASPSMLPSSVAPDQILAYAYLFKNLSFEHPFIRAKAPLEFGDKKSPVASFGLWPDHDLHNWSELAQQVVIHSYASPTEWVVELKNQSKGDRLIIARLPGGKTLGETADHITAALVKKTGQENAMRHEDQLRVPLLNFDITCTFSEFSGRSIKGENGAAVIDYARQGIRLKLDERGAILKSEAAFGATAMPIPRDPRRMICNGPFAIVMMREGAPRPYFFAWIEDPQLLVGWK